MITIKQIIKNKYYKYVPGEFFPIYTNNELINKKEFHMYKAKRAIWITSYYIQAIKRNYKLAQQ